MSKLKIGMLVGTIFLAYCSKEPIPDKPTKFDPVDKSILNLDGWEISKSVYDFSINSRDIFFVNSEIGFVVGYNGDIYKTTDSGEIWTKQNSGTTLHLHSVYFLNENVGFASSQAMNCLDPDCNKGCVLLKTTNGGEEWTKTFFPEYLSIRSLKFFDESNGIAIIYTLGNFGNQKKNIAITSDGGVSWTLSDLVINAPYDKLVFVNNLIYVAGENQRIFRSADFGHTWITLNTPVKTTSNIREIYFYNENIGFIDGVKETFKTKDGGLSWTKIDFPFDGFGTLHFSNENEGFNLEYISAYEGGGDWPVFKGSIFYETKDGGLTWTKSELIPSLSLNLSTFPQRELGFAFSGSTEYRIKKLE
jgi:photosystem II stability/assembly factor-like uncharacterized protein